jgi:hypothetical protein
MKTTQISNSVLPPAGPSADAAAVPEPVTVTVKPVNTDGGVYQVTVRTENRGGSREGSAVVRTSPRQFAFQTS